MYAKALILSWAIIVAEYGTCISPTQKLNIENWKQQLAANIRSAGITILLFKNQRPIVSHNIKTMAANAACIEISVEKTFLR